MVIKYNCNVTKEAVKNTITRLTNQIYKVLPLKEILTCPGEVNTIIDYIKKCQNFYKGHCYETNKFSCSIALGPSPNCNAKHVTEYWHSHGKPEFKIVEYNISDVIYGEGDFEEVSDEEFLATLKW